MVIRFWKKNSCWGLLPNAICWYMDSGQFVPRQENDMTVFEKIIDSAALK